MAGTLGLAIMYLNNMNEFLAELYYDKQTVGKIDPEELDYYNELLADIAIEDSKGGEK